MLFRSRIGAAGHGGQVLLSTTTRELVEDELPTGVAIRDLGERRLKDLDRPERLFQLEIEGMRSEFAQLKTLDVDLRMASSRTADRTTRLHIDDVRTQIARALDPAVQESAGSGPAARTSVDGADYDPTIDPVSCWVDYGIRVKQ